MCAASCFRDVKGKPFFSALYPQNTSDTRHVSLVPTQTSVLTSVVCPAIQFSSDTVYLEIASDPTG